MNTMIKGSIAGATGVALLMGGFGTYALWSDSEDLPRNSVTSGNLNIDTTAGVVRQRQHRRYPGQRRTTANLLDGPG